MHNDAFAWLSLRSLLKNVTLENVSLERNILKIVSLAIPNEMMPKNLSLERQILKAKKLAKRYIL